MKISVIRNSPAREGREMQERSVSRSTMQRDAQLKAKRGISPKNILIKKLKPMQEAAQSQPRNLTNKSFD